MNGEGATINERKYLYWYLCTSVTFEGDYRNEEFLKELRVQVEFWIFEKRAKLPTGTRTFKHARGGRGADRPPRPAFCTVLQTKISSINIDCDSKKDTRYQ